jgi:hypothetical protein
MTTAHEPGMPHYPESPTVMEERLIEEITQVQAQLGLDPARPEERDCPARCLDRGARPAVGPL